VTPHALLSPLCSSRRREATLNSPREQGLIALKALSLLKRGPLGGTSGERPIEFARLATLKGVGEQACALLAHRHHNHPARAEVESVRDAQISPLTER